jgi:hypothetical protein
MTTVVVSVTADVDDGNADGGSPQTWHINYAASNADWISASYSRSSAWRFLSVNVPQGTTLTSATLELNVTSAGSGTATIKGEAVDSAAQWADSSANSPKDMTQTTASASYTAGTSGIVTVDVKSIVQEIVNRAGWVANNNLRIGFSTVSGISVAEEFEDYAAAGAHPAKLTIVYGAGAAPAMLGATVF